MSTVQPVDLGERFWLAVKFVPGYRKTVMQKANASIVVILVHRL